MTPDVRLNVNSADRNFRNAAAKTTPPYSAGFNSAARASRSCVVTFNVPSGPTVSSRDNWLRRPGRFFPRRRR